MHSNNILDPRSAQESFPHTPTSIVITGIAHENRIEDEHQYNHSSYFESYKLKRAQTPGFQDLDMKKSSVLGLKSEDFI